MIHFQTGSTEAIIQKFSRKFFCENQKLNFVFESHDLLQEFGCQP